MRWKTKNIQYRGVLYSITLILYHYFILNFETEYNEHTNIIFSHNNFKDDRLLYLDQKTVEKVHKIYLFHSKNLNYEYAIFILDKKPHSLMLTIGSAPKLHFISNAFVSKNFFQEKAFQFRMLSTDNCDICFGNHYLSSNRHEPIIRIYCYWLNIKSYPIAKIMCGKMILFKFLKIIEFMILFIIITFIFRKICCSQKMP